jgi:hypothetical protein
MHSTRVPLTSSKGSIQVYVSITSNRAYFPDKYDSFAADMHSYLTINERLFV